MGVKRRLIAEWPRALIALALAMGLWLIVNGEEPTTGWVRVRGRRKTPGLPITYGTTDKFLEHFGIESLDTLPGKADLEAEGLLTDVIPSGFQMPDEEALSEEDMSG